MRNILVSLTLGTAFLILTPTAVFACMDYDYSNDSVLFSDKGHAAPVEVIVEYFAAIAKRDLRNSSGVRLTSFAAVLQQDRANLHKSGVADSFEADGNYTEKMDTYFTTLERRNLLSSTDYFFQCDWSKTYVEELKQQIVDGQVPGMVGVTLFRRPDGTLGISIQPVG